MSQRSVYVGSDPKLIPRVKQYLRTCRQGKTVNITNMVGNLQQTYSEYRRKKRNAFKIAVMKAYDAICQEKNLDSERSTANTVGTESDTMDSDMGSGSDVPNDVNYITVEDTNAANSSLRELYSRKPKSKSRNSARETRDRQPSPKKQKSADSAQKPMLESGTESNPEHKVQHQQPSNVESLKSQTESPAVSVPLKKRKTTEDGKDGTASQMKKGKKEVVVQQSTLTFADIGGNEKCIQDVCQLLVHLKHAEVYETLGVPPPRGLLLHGPPGCGKTLLAHAIAGELQLPFIKVASTELVSGVSGESEEKIRELFEKALTSAPCIVFIDEIDAITPKRETVQREMERRIVAQLLTCMDDLNAKDNSTQVLVIGATNRPDALDPALRRAGRFDREIKMGIPDRLARSRILKVLCRKLRLSSGFDFERIASQTPGYVAADLVSLTREAAMHAVNRVFQGLQEVSPSSKVSETGVYGFREETSPPVELSPEVSSALRWLRDQAPLTTEQLTDLFVEMSDFEHAVKVVQPSAKREGFATVPDVVWSDIGALHDVREELQLTIMAPIRYPEKFKSLGLNTPAGILLCGPPGCGKTLLAKAIANESGINFISVKGPELLNMYVGESERAVRQCFQRARNSSPCVIFFDELDALCPRRTDSSESGASSRVVNQLLTEMDGVEGRTDVFILGATNRPDIIDPAVLRPGRLDKVLFVTFPTPHERIDILMAITKGGTKPPFDTDIAIKEVGLDSRCDGFTGADLAALVRESSVIALKEFIVGGEQQGEASIKVRKQHVEQAFSRIRLSVSPKDQQMYSRMKVQFTRTAASCPSPTPMSLDGLEPTNSDRMDFENQENS